MNNSDKCGSNVCRHTTPTNKSAATPKLYDNLLEEGMSQLFQMQMNF